MANPRNFKKKGRFNGKPAKGPKDQREDRKRFEEDSSWTKQRGENDISWYSRYPNLLVAAGSFPYPYRPGSTMQLGQVTDTAATPKTYPLTYTVPGVMAMGWVPSFGISNKATDPASIVGKEMYARVRATFSGKLDADAPDYVMYLGALDSIYSYIAWLKRLYRVLVAWSPENYMLPNNLLYAMQLNDVGIKNLQENRMQLFQSINELIYQSRKFTCPAVMDLMNRHYWMSDNVYSDADSINAQLYLFQLVGVYEFAMLNMPDGNPGPGLQMTQIPTGAVTVSQLYEFGRDLIDALVAWDDAYTISGYLKAAYKDVPNFVVGELEMGEQLTTLYVPEVLSQIENSRVVPNAFSNKPDLSGFNVTQDVPTNAVISNPTMTLSDYYSTYKTGSAKLPPLLSIHSDQPTVADSVVASRLQAAVDYTVDGTKYNVTIYAATEVPLWWMIYQRNSSSGVALYQAPAFFDLSAVSNARYLFQVISVDQFDWHPFIWVVGYDNVTPPENANLYPLGDVHNITTISRQDLENLHKICLYSELNAFSV